MEGVKNLIYNLLFEMSKKINRYATGSGLQRYYNKY